MAKLTRRAVLRSSLGAAAAGVLARPYIANAAATTATIWWVQGFAHEEDISFEKIVADYQKLSGNTIEHSIIPYAPIRQKIIAALTSGGEVPDVFQNTPTEMLALHAWEGRLVDVSDVVETQKAKLTEAMLQFCNCYNRDEKKRGFLWRALRVGRPRQPHLAAARRKGRLQDGGHPEDVGCLLRFLQRRAEEIARPRHARGLRRRIYPQHGRKRLKQPIQLLPDRLWRSRNRHPRRQTAPRRSEGERRRGQKP